MWIDREEISKTERMLNFFLIHNCCTSEDTLDEIQRGVEFNNILHRGFSKFKKIKRDGKEFYIFSGGLFIASPEPLLFEKCDDYLVHQIQTGDDSFCGYMAFEMENGLYWVVEFDEN